MRTTDNGEWSMHRLITLASGIVFLVVFAPLFLIGVGEVVMGLPFIGVSIAALAGYLLRLKKR